MAFEVRVSAAMPQPRVAVVSTGPSTVLRDYERVMRLARYARSVAEDRETALSLCLGPRRAGVAGSTTPWQLDGVLSTLIRDGYDTGRIFPYWQGSARREINGPLAAVLSHHRIRMASPPESGDRQFPGASVIHLPPLKVRGAMESAWRDGNQKPRIELTPDAAADLLAIHQQAHPGIFAVMDGSRAATSVLLAGADLVAVDAVAANLMGLDPMSIDYIRVAHDRRLGCGDTREIEVVGDDPGEVDLTRKPLARRQESDWARLFRSY